MRPVRNTSNKSWSDDERKETVRPYCLILCADRQPDRQPDTEPEAQSNAKPDGQRQIPRLRKREGEARRTAKSPAC